MPKVFADVNVNDPIPTESFPISFPCPQAALQLLQCPRNSHGNGIPQARE